MNAFTKDELEDLLNCVIMYTSEFQLQRHPYQHLIDKINYQIEHIDRLSKLADRFEEWQREAREQHE